MDPQILQLLDNNVEEFISNIMLGTIVGFLDSHFGEEEDKIVNKPEMSQLGYVTAVTYLFDILFSLMDAANLRMSYIPQRFSGNLGSILGLYLGLKVGKLTDKALTHIRPYLDSYLNEHL